MTTDTHPVAGVLAFALLPAVAEELHTFKRIQLNDQFWSEGANFGDLNNDGKNDLISGPSGGKGRTSRSATSSIRRRRRSSSSSGR